METYTIPENVNVFGLEVTTFPQGVAEAFDVLIKNLPRGSERVYYGISECIGDRVVYKAATLQNYSGEAAEYGYESYTLEKGDYLATTITEWRAKIACIKDVFNKMFDDDRTDRGKPCIEVYKDQHEMMCLVRMADQQQLFSNFEHISAALLQQLSSCPEEHFNVVPFENSWTAAQLAEHIARSNAAFAQAFAQPGRLTHRDTGARVQELKSVLLDFDRKFTSPESVVPRRDSWQKESATTELKKCTQKALQAAAEADLSEMLSIPPLGDLTKLEMLFFMRYHTERHVRQLSSILEALKTGA